MMQSRDPVCLAAFARLLAQPDPAVSETQRGHTVDPHETHR